VLCSTTKLATQGPQWVKSTHYRSATSLSASSSISRHKQQPSFSRLGLIIAT
jgi:hypothetical protein